MRGSLVLFIIFIVVGGWTANKFLQRANKSSEEKMRFIELTKNYNDNTALFLSEKAKLYHDEAFAASYIMWILSPASELDLASHYDKQIYYRELSKMIAEVAKKEGQEDAAAAIIDIARHYSADGQTKKNTQATAPRTTPPAAKGNKESLLKSGKLGEKRTTPSSRRQDHDR